MTFAFRLSTKGMAVGVLVSVGGTGVNVSVGGASVGINVSVAGELRGVNGVADADACSTVSVSHCRGK